VGAKVPPIALKGPATSHQSSESGVPWSIGTLIWPIVPFPVIGECRSLHGAACSSWLPPSPASAGSHHHRRQLARARCHEAMAGGSAGTGTKSVRSPWPTGTGAGVLRDVRNASQVQPGTPTAPMTTLSLTGHSRGRLRAGERQPREILLRAEAGRRRTGHPWDPQAVPQLADGTRDGIIDRQTHGPLWRPAKHPGYTSAAAANRPAAATTCNDPPVRDMHAERPRPSLRLLAHFAARVGSICH